MIASASSLSLGPATAHPAPTTDPEFWRSTMNLLNLMLSLVWATFGWMDAPMDATEATVTSNCAYVDSGPIHQCESTVEDWRSYRALQDEHILNGTFTLPEIWEEFFSADVDQISFTPGASPTLVQGSEAVRLASEQMGQIPVVDVIDHFIHVHVIDRHTVTETFDSTLVTADWFPFDLRISGTEVAHRKGGQEDWKEDLVVVNVAFVPKEG